MYVTFVGFKLLFQALNLYYTNLKRRLLFECGILLSCSEFEDNINGCGTIVKDEMANLVCSGKQ